MFTEDLSVFFSTSEFASRFMQQAAEPVAFSGILSEVDEELLQGYVVGTVRELRYPTAAATLRRGDQLDQLVDDPESASVAVAWKCHADPRRENDGRESVVYLVPSQA